MKKFLMLMSDGFEEVEALTTVDLLRRAGLEVCMCSITNSIELSGSHNIEIKCELKLADISIDKACSFDSLILPGGGPNSKALREDKRVLEIVRNYNKEGKLISAICAAPSVLQAAGILDGKNATSYPNCIDETRVNYKEDNVVIDGNIITSRGLGTAIDFALFIIKVAIDEEKSKEIAKQVIYKK